ncbi:MAG: 50S ribosomal protein L23 [Pseudomonadales bacterium]|uniref:Large ribosomal subunit protein uL23 n=1 Tax=Oleiphilus messinensis TaxID=141451 RepID=A0A1Y0I3G0_9GAMM|nr:50S ribosomal protein L23 [Oleiphilus messinensis]ARU54780.1 50S ribosomal subunit protein L23 [Oleiphilus messinensis]MCG8610562.1 50S ribosomal protein L23 [Pseudomonadales bacterium]
MSQERIYKVLLGRHLSEKAAIAQENGQVVFRVAPDATKPEIKAAVEQLYNVKVDSVSVLNQKGKTKRTVRGLGKRKSVRKAYVSLSEGHEIELLDVE